MVERGVTRWEIGFRRNLRTFEQDSLVELRETSGNIPIFPDVEDEIIWTGDTSGLFSVKVGIETAIKAPLEDSSPSTSAWIRAAPLIVQTFVWCVLKNKILTRMELKRRGMLGSSEYLFCSL